MERSYPFVDGATTDAEFSAMFRSVFPSSVLDGLLVTADSTGLNVKLPTGSGYVRGHYYANKDAKTLEIDAGGASPRIDTIVLRLEYGSANNITAQVKKGTPASEPVPPTLTQTDTGVFEYALADVNVKANAVTIAAEDVTDRRVMFADALKKTLGLLAMAASVITSGTFNLARIPSLPASKIDSGMFDAARIPHTGEYFSAGTARVYFGTGDSAVGDGEAYIGLAGSADASTNPFWLQYNNVTIFGIDRSGNITLGKIPIGQVTGDIPASRLPNTESLNNNIRGKSFTGNSPSGTGVGDNRVVAIDPLGQLGVLEGRLSAGYTGVFVQSSAPASPSVGDIWVW